jgi:hypothetical protein
MAKTFLDEVKEKYDSEKEKQKILWENNKKQLVETIKVRILESVNNGGSSLYFVIDEEDLPYIDFVRNWLSENQFKVWEIPVHGTCKINLCISGWAE